MKRVLIAAAATACACGSTPQSFVPAERATGETMRGYTAAEYDLDTEQGSFGDVQVFSRGARIRSIGGDPRTVVHVGFVVENNSDQPMELSRLQLDSSTLDRVDNAEPFRVDGPTTIPPDQRRVVSAYFAMPRGVDPQDLEAFRVRWRLSSDGVVVSQLTPFVEREEQYYYSPFYDPFYHPHFAPGLTPGRIIVHRYPYVHYHWL